MTKRSNSSLIIVGGLACGLALGWAGESLRQRPATTSASAAMPSAADEIEKASLLPGKLGSSKNAPAETSANHREGKATPHISPLSPEFEKAIAATLEIADPLDREAQIREFLREIPVEELPAAFAKAKKMTTSDRWEIIGKLGSRWAETDPRGAVAFGLQNGNFGPWSGYNPFLNGAAAKWLITAPAEAMAWIQTLPPGTTRNSLIQSAITTVSRTNPQEALQILQKNSFSVNGRWVAENLFTDWAERDPDGAAAAALQLKGDMGVSALRTVAQSWTQVDPAKAVAWAGTIPNLATRKEMIGSIADQWSKADPHAEIAWALGLSDTNLRRETLRTGIGRLAATDLSSALEQIHALPSGDDHDQALLAAIDSAAAKDAHGALSLLDELPAGPNRNSAATNLCDVWSQSDPRAALDWLVQNVPAAKADGRYNNNDGVAGIVQRWMGGSPRDALAWAQALPEGDNRDAAMAAVVESLASTDFSQAQSIFNQLSPDAQRSAVSTLTNNLLQQDTGKARAWVESLPEGSAQNNGLMAVARQWADQNPTAAADWLGTLAPGKGRDKAVSGFSGTVFQTDPQSALSWVMTMADPTDRDQQTERFMSRWMQSDSTAARNWLQANQQISPEEKDRILNN